jgi:hypothetical protein
MDSGTTATMIKTHLSSSKPNQKRSKQTVRWETLGGIFQTNLKVQLRFKLPKFNRRKTITWDCYLDESEQDSNSQYDMIMGTDLIKELGLTLNFLDKSMTWESTTAPMVNLNQSMTRFMLNNISQTLQQTRMMLNAENRQKHILDADYTPLNIEQFTNGQDHLNNLEKDMLIKLLIANLTMPHRYKI